MVIAIDGPGGAGKSTTAKALAKRLGITYIDTGAMYRAVALAVSRLGFSTRDAAAVCGVLEGISVDILYDGTTGSQLIYLNGEDVSSKIRTPAISIGASDVSAIPEVRYKMVALQREIATGRDVVMDGRDIGTFVFPDAKKKYFLTASLSTRAERRHREILSKGGETSYESCRKDLEYRDENDSTRQLAPLARAEDAILIETDSMTEEEVGSFILTDLSKHD